MVLSIAHISQFLPLVFIPLWPKLTKNEKWNETNIYYFSISVGGGSAGSVLAARLSEISDWNILLIEAGGEQSRKVKIPWFHLWMVDSVHDWKYSTEPQKDALWAFDDQVNLHIYFLVFN